MDPYKILNFNYNGIEREGIDDEINKIYVQKSEEYKRIIKDLYGKYDFPKDYKLLKDLDIVEVVRKKYKQIDFSTEDLEEIGKKYDEIENARRTLIEYVEKFIKIDKAYSMTKTADLRLIYACEYEKDKSGCEPDLVEQIEYIAADISDKDINLSSNIEKVGKLEYKNWTGAYVGYTIKYKLKDENGNEQSVFSEISEKDLNDPEYMGFLNRTILNKNYVNYAIEKNGGYLGVPKATKSGEYIIEFDTEELVAARKYQEMIEKEVARKETTEEETVEDDFVL